MPSIFLIPHHHEDFTEYLLLSSFFAAGARTVVNVRKSQIEWYVGILPVVAVWREVAFFKWISVHTYMHCSTLVPGTRY